MGKNKYWLFSAAIVSMLAAVTAGYADEGKSADRPGFTKNQYLSAGGRILDLGKLNASLAAAGYHGFSDYAATIGGGFTTRHKRIVGGLDLNGYAWQTQKKGNNKSSLYGVEGIATLGFNVLPPSPALLYPMLSLGGGMMHVKTFADQTAFVQALAPGGRSAMIMQKFGVLGLGAGFDVDIPRKKPGKAFTLGVRAGYSFDLTPGKDWSQGRTDVTGGPSLNASGPYLRLNIGKTWPQSWGKHKNCHGDDGKCHKKDSCRQ